MRRSSVAARRDHTTTAPCYLAAATSHIREALKHDPDSSDLKVVALLGDLLRYDGEYDEARQCYLRGLVLNSNSSWCLGGLVELALQDENYAEGIERAHQLITLAPYNAAYYKILLELYFKSSEFDKADSVLDAGLLALPSHTSKVELLARTGRF